VAPARLTKGFAHAGVPLLTEAAAMLAAYLAAERDLGRIAPDPEAVRKVVTTVLASAVR
jgi:hypothetical protein